MPTVAIGVPPASIVDLRGLTYRSSDTTGRRCHSAASIVHPRGLPYRSVVRRWPMRGRSRSSSVDDPAYDSDQDDPAPEAGTLWLFFPGTFLSLPLVGVMRVARPRAGVWSDALPNPGSVYRKIAACLRC